MPFELYRSFYFIWQITFEITDLGKLGGDDNGNVERKSGEK